MRIAILGCGYVGLELGRRLARNGHRVIGVRRSSEGIESIESRGLRAVRADVTDATAVRAIPDADVIVYSASAGRDGDPHRTYVVGLETVVAEFERRSDPPDRLIYTSSTGVYGDHGGAWVDEETDPDPASERARVLLEAERVAVTGCAGTIDGTVARLAGLYGPGRYRVDRYLERPVRSGYLNLVHRDDAAGAIGYLIAEDLAREEVVLVVDDEPVWRPALAAWLAERVGEARPTDPHDRPERTTAPAGDRQSARIRRDKRCSNRKLRALGYEFEYPTFRQGYQAAPRVGNAGR